MNTAYRIRMAAVWIALVATLLTLPSCSGSSDPTVSQPNPLVPTFAGETNAGPGVRMSAGEILDDGRFEVRIEAVGPLDDVNSVSFRVRFDPEFILYQSLVTNASFLTTAGVDTVFGVQLLGDDTLLCSATRVGADEVGVDLTELGLVLVIRFTSVAATGPSGTPLTFTAERAVRVCAVPNAPCSDLDDADLDWTGGGVVITDSAGGP